MDLVSVADDNIRQQSALSICLNLAGAVSSVLALVFVPGIEGDGLAIATVVLFLVSAAVGICLNALALVEVYTGNTFAMGVSSLSFFVGLILMFVHTDFWLSTTMGQVLYGVQISVVVLSCCLVVCFVCVLGTAYNDRVRIFT